MNKDVNKPKPNELWVIECNGTPRSGKGTITSGLASNIPGAALEETGIDYRTVAFYLVQEKMITKNSSTESIMNAIDGKSLDEISHFVSKRQDIVNAYSQQALYDNTVSSLVGKVGQHPSVRKVVKDAFRNRVSRHLQDPYTHLLFIDGRDLIKVIDDMPGINILIRLFIDCQPFVAASREAHRQNIDITDPGNDEWYRSALQNIRDRQHADETRKIDPVAIDKNAINYWFNAAAEYETAEHLANERNISFAAAADMIASRNDFRTGGRHGVGAKAYAENRQVYFDTTEISKTAMLNLAQRMIEEALAKHSGNYKALSKHLIES